MPFLLTPALPGPVRRSPARAWLVALAAGMTFMLVGLVSRRFTHEAGGLAAIWPCNAVLLVFMLRAPVRRWRGLLAAGLVGGWLANLPGQDALVAVGMAMANVVEVGCAAAMIRRARPARLDVGRTGDLFVLCGLASLATLPAALLAASVLAVTVNAPMAATFTGWVLAASLGYLVVTPVILILSQTHRLERLSRHLLRRPWSMLLLAGVLLGVFAQTRYPFLFLVPPALLFVCFELELAGAAAGIALTSVVAIGFAVIGRGPTTLIHGGQTEQVMILQLFLAVATLGSLPVAAVLEQRRRLTRASEKARLRARRSAQAAHESARIARMAEDLAQVGYWRMNPRQGLVDWSPQTYRIYGFSPQHGPMLRTEAAKMNHPDDSERVGRVVKTAFETGAEFNFESRIVRADGSVRQVVMRGGCERNAQGEVSDLVGAMLDVTDIRSAEIAVREADVRYRLMAEHASDTIVHLNLAGIVIYASPACQAIFGFRPDEWVGRSVADLIHPDDVAFVMSIGPHLLETGRSRLNDPVYYRGQHKDGRWMWIEGSPTLVRNAEGAPVEIIDILRDVTARKTTEAALESALQEAEAAMVAASISERRYRLLAENATDMIVRFTLGGRITFATPASREVLGVGPEALVGVRIMDRVHPDDVDALQQAYNDYVAAGPQAEPIVLQFRYRHADGRWVWLEGQPRVEFEDGRATGIQDVVRDVTARKAIEAKLAAALKEAEAATAAASLSEERYRLMAENATDMISQFTLDGRVTFITQACLPILGYLPEELVGERTLDHTHPDDRERVAKTFRDYIAAGPGAPQIVVQFRIRRKDGVYVWVEGQPKVLWEGGRAIGTQDVIRDVTTRKQIEDELIAAREQAEAGGRAKADFLANMSHELRTPLNSILGFAEVLTRSDLPAAQARYAALIADSGQSLLAIVNDVLDLSRIDADGLRLEAAPTPLRRLVGDCMALVADQAADKGLRVRTVLPEGEAVVLADAARLRQVLLNLLGNAVKFTPAGEVAAELTLEPLPVAPGAAAEAAVTLCVRDTGIGIAADRVEHLFGRFEQADTSISRRFGGTGLGLSICKGLVEHMGGIISAESAPGLGSAFTVRLRLPLAEAAAAAPEVLAQALPRLRRLRLLVAEDLAVNQELIRLMLEPHGVRIEAVYDGAAAVEAAAAGVYDLILMDMQMPGMDGLEATRRIRAGGGRSAGAPIVALTANVLPEQVARCRTAGMDDHIGKPFTRESVLAAVERWTGAAEADLAPALAADPDDRDVDLSVLEDLRAAVGAAPVAGLLRALQQQLRTVLEHGDEAGEALRMQAHAVLGAAGTLGFQRASDACRALERACLDGAPLATPAAAARSACRDAAVLIDGLIRDAA